MYLFLKPKERYLIVCGTKGGLPQGMLEKNGPFVGYSHVFTKETPFAGGGVPL
jgi:hypothetical protein